MATFICLQASPIRASAMSKRRSGRAETFKEMAKKSGVTVKDLYWTLGTYDVVASRRKRDRAILERLLARQRSLRDPASVFLRGDEAHPRQDGLGKVSPTLRKRDSRTS
jgi:uncharacterized protein with GYD domain